MYFKYKTQIPNSDFISFRCCITLLIKWWYFRYCYYFWSHHYAEILFKQLSRIFINWTVEKFHKINDCTATEHFCTQNGRFSTLLPGVQHCLSLYNLTTCMLTRVPLKPLELEKLKLASAIKTTKVLVKNMLRINFLQFIKHPIYIYSIKGTVLWLC